MTTAPATVDYSDSKLHLALLEMFSKFREVSSDCCFIKGNTIPITLWEQWKEFKSELEQAALYSPLMNKTWKYVQHCFKNEPEANLEVCEAAISDSQFDFGEFAMSLIGANHVRAATIANSLLPDFAQKKISNAGFSYRQISELVDNLCISAICRSADLEDGKSHALVNPTIHGVNVIFKQSGKATVEPGVAILPSFEVDGLLVSLFMPRAVVNFYEDFMLCAETGKPNKDATSVITNFFNSKESAMKAMPLIDSCLETFADRLPKDFIERLNGRGVEDLLDEMKMKAYEDMIAERAAKETQK